MMSFVITIVITIFSILLINLSNCQQCQSLIKYGNNIENKAYLAPIIIITDSYETLAGEDFILANKVKAIKGSLDIQSGLDTVIVEGFVKNGNPSDPCFLSVGKKEKKIMFLTISPSHSKQYKILLTSEPFSDDNIQKIKRIICPGCANKPTPEIKQIPGKSELICFDNSPLKAIVKWIKPAQDIQSVQMTKEGASLQLSNTAKVKKNLYSCYAENLVGSSEVYFSYQSTVTRCSKEDEKKLCNDNGKCYIDEDNKFCRCDTPYLGLRCQPTNYIQKVLSTATTKISIIGALLVVGGIIIIMIILACIWKCCIKRMQQENDDEEEKVYENLIHLKRPNKQHQVTNSKKAPTQDWGNYQRTEENDIHL